MAATKSPSFLSNHLTRRDFLRGSALAAGAAFLPSCASRHAKSPNAKLNIGIIGCGGKGASDAEGVAGENIVALCDIDENTLNRAAKKYPGAKLYRDYRQMLEQERDLDAVTVSTPDHHHAPAAMMAIKLRKHVYVQKPLTHSIYEARMLTLAARKYKVATMMGNQGHASEESRVLCELIWADAIGPVREVHCWTDRPIWPQGRTRPDGSDPVPANLDWDLWLGPSPFRPFKASYPDGKKPVYHPFAWRGWWDFGTGALGDMACHVMDAANWALKLGHPTSVEAETSGLTTEMAPNWSVIRYQFPARHEMPPLQLIWHDGGKKPAPELLGLKPGEKFMDNGLLFIGDKGKLTCVTYGGSPRFTPDSRTQEFPKATKILPRSVGHYEEWIEACKGAPNTGASFDYAGPFTEMVLLGNLAVRAGKKIEWDGPNLRAKNAPEVAQYIRREYRKGWSL